MTHFYPTLALYLMLTVVPTAPAYPCPSGGDINPCKCYSAPGGLFPIDMKCPDTTTEEELTAVFQANIPYKKFRSFYMDGNQNIKTLSDGMLGDVVSFKKFEVDNGALTTVESGALEPSVNMTYLIHFYQNSISAFPFALLSQMPLLSELRLYGNQITGFPSISSQSLEILSLGYNPLGVLPETAFASTPSLREIHLYGSGITEILPGTIVGMTNLTMVSLRDNQLSALPEACIVMAGLPNTNVFLHNNSIASVAPNAVAGVGSGLVDLHDNLLTVLEETTWRPLLEDGVTLDLRGNPLTCGCDLAWLILDSPGLMPLVDSETSCADGRLLHELDPAGLTSC